MLQPKNFWMRVLAVVMILSLVLTACSKPQTTPVPVQTEAVKVEQPTPTTEQPTKAPEVEPTKVPEAEPTQTPVPEVVAVDDAWANVDPTGQTVTFWHQHTRDREKALQEIVDAFNQTNEWGITIVAEYQGGYPDIFNKMLVFMNTSDAPGLVVAYQNQAATYQVADALVDMNPLVNSPKWGLSAEEQADFFPGFFAQDVFPLFNGARLAFPPNRSMEMLYYNVEWLAELKAAGAIDFDGPPTTPEQFKAAACAAVTNPFSKAKAEGSMGYELQLSDASHVAAWTFAFGGDIFDYQTNQFAYDSEAGIASATFLQDLFNEGCATKVAENYGDQTDFGNGKLLFTTSSSSGLPFYKTAVDSGAAFQWSVAAIPHTTPNPVQNIYGASISIPKTSPEVELAAWLFLKYYTSTDVQNKWARVSQYFPVRASVAANMTDIFEADPAYKAAFDLLQYGVFEPPVPGYDFVRVKVGEAIAVIVDGGDVAATLGQLTTDANLILNEQVSLIPEPADPWYKIDPSGQTITFWHNHTGAREETLKVLVDEFNQTNEWGITVVAENQGSYSDIFNKMLGFLNTQDAPDLVVAYQNQAASYQVADALVDINSLVKSYKWGLSEFDKTDFFASFYNQDIFPNFGNARLGFPPNRSMEMLFFNADWLAELKAAGAIDFDGPPTTPEQFKAAACAAAANPFSKGPGDGVGYEYALADASHLAAWIFAFGGDVYDYKANQFIYNSDAAIAAATFIQDLFNNNCAILVAEAYGDQTDFGNGKLLFTTSSSSGLPFYASAVEAGPKFSWSVAAIPHTTENPVQNVYGASVSMPKTTPERELATWLFLKYYTSAEVQARWAIASNYFPVRASVATGLVDYFASNPAYKTAFDMLKYGKYEPPVPGYDPVRVKVGEAMAAILNGADVKATLDQLTADANAILAEWLTVVPTPTP